MSTIAIIGGGITGLTTAFELRREGLSVTLYEADARVGGVIQSIRKDGYLAEFGPNTILETSPLIGALVNDLGLAGRRLYSEPRAEKRYIVRGHKPVELPGSGLRFLKTPLFSSRAKLRLMWEPFVRRARADVEESLAQFVKRRIGQEFLDYAINPFVAGVYAGDPARLSVKHAFPKLHALEQRYGSLLLGQFLGARERKRRAEVSKQNARKLSFDEGLDVLTETLGAQLGEALLLSCPVVGIRQDAHGWTVTSRRDGREQQQEHAAVIYTGPAHRLPEIRLMTDHRVSCAPLAKIQYPPVVSVVLGFRREDVAHPLDGFGMLVPEVEGVSILGTLFSSSLFPNRAPAGHVTLTSYLGGTRAPELAVQSTDRVMDLTLRDLRTILGVTGKPTFSHCFLYPKAIPQYEVGFDRFKELMDSVESQAPGLFLAGNYRDGISLGDSIVSGHQVAERAAKHCREGEVREVCQAA
jgi:oxygen-dependent protoporphyrinogen oxidase